MTKPERRVWPDVLAHIRHHAPNLSRRWFHDLEPTGLNGGVATIQAATPTQRDYLEASCADAFDDALRTVTGRLVTARFIAPGDLNTDDSNTDNSPAKPHTARATGDAPEPAAAARDLPIDERPAPKVASGRRPAVEHRARPARDSLLSHQHGTLTLTPDYAFEHFIVGPGNRLAHAAARAVGDRPGKAYNPLFIHGDVGLGKTHLLQAICLDIIEQQPGVRIFYTSCEHFITRFIADVKAGRMDEFRHQFREVDALVIDDIHFLAKRDRTQEEFFHTFNALYQADKQIVMTSDAPPEEIPDLEDRLVSRFKWGLVTQVAPPTFETRLEIIKEKGRLRGIEIPDEVGQFVAQREQANIRELEGDLTKLQLHAAMVGVETLTIEMAVEALGEPIAVHETPVTVEQIIGQVTEYFGVRTADLQSRKRSRSITTPRQVGMYLARKHTRHSLEEIGGYFGGRDHTTVLHACRAIEGRSQDDQSISASVSALESRLRIAGRDR
ncbi:MAG: chromosomal replication initiator protein DnaA [Planctomycetota bacterium]